MRSAAQGAVLATALLAMSGIGASISIAAADEPAWWSPGEGRRMPAVVEYANEAGKVRVLNAEGAFDTRGHAFFEPIGSNGRACVTCHQPADGMSLSAKTAQQRWEETGGKDPLFAAIDGSNCPSLPQDRKESTRCCSSGG